MKKIIILIILVSVNVFLFGQNVEFSKDNFPNNKKELKEAKKNLKKGDGFYEIQGKTALISAIDYYTLANDFNSNNADLNYKLGNCYLITSNHLRAIEYLEKALELNATIPNDAKYLLAQAYHNNLEFDKAIKFYNEYLSKITVSESVEIRKDVDRRVAQCNTAKNLVESPIRVFIDNLGPNINSQFPDYSPIINGDETTLIFTSRRDNTTGGEIAIEDDLYFEDVLFAEYENGKWKQATNPGKPINDDGHDATVGFSSDGQKLFIYRNESNNGGDIYQCDLKGDKWSKPKALHKNINTKYRETSASFSYDGKTIYFVSDKEGGFGDLDIYSSTLNAKGKWSKAVNLGPNINTELREDAVFMHPDGKTMYFSSQGHDGMGGYDIFKSVYENGQWSKAVNIGYPINTPYDDVYFTMSASGQHGYYSSQLDDSYGDLDIYMITFLGDEKPMINNTGNMLIASIANPVDENVIQEALEINSAQLTLLKGHILSEDTKEPLEANIVLIDIENNTELATFTSNSVTGKYLVSLPSGKNYGIAVEAEGYLFHSENFNIAQSSEYEEIEKDIYLKRIKIGESIVLKNIFFDFDKATLRPESKNELNRLVDLMENNPQIKIEMGGHTDNVGSDSYNQTLSEKRAKSVVDYLIAQGIDSGRLTFKGYGETNPIESNDTDAGRQLNRRTEFMIIE